MAEELKLFRTWSSLFALRVVWALKLKGIKYEEIYEDLSNKSPSLVQHNPVYGKIPALVHNGKPICESLVILEYVEETWKHNPLLSEDPHERARVRFWVRFGEDKVMESIRSGLLLAQGKEKEEEGKLAALESLKHLEDELRRKKFFGGEKIGLVDLALGWLAYYLNIYEEVSGAKLVDKEKFPLLMAWMQEFYNIPEIQETWPLKAKLVTKFAAIREARLAKENHFK